ncbi:MAG TPA: ASKHA domain-containing protein [Thermoproteota archaeon]|nr:ASKHA domain-containing protein [Thermoproteota archaeon]
MPVVRVLPDDLTLRVDVDDDLLSALRVSGLQIESICNGRGTCGKCLVKVISGDVSPPTEREKEWQLLVGPEARLACQTRAVDNVTLFLPETSRTSEAKILTVGRMLEAKPSPLVQVKIVEVPAPSLSDQSPDVGRLLKQVGVTSYDPALLGRIPAVLRDSNWQVQAVVRDGSLVDLLPRSVTRRILGVAADIGTTTVVVYLFDLVTGKLLDVKADYNAQIKYGEDVVTRISYAINDGLHLASVQRAIAETLNGLIAAALSGVRASPADVYDVVAAGNSIMTSFLVGADPGAISRAPYTPPFLDSVRVNLHMLGLSGNPACELRSVPLISGYVGGDVVADILVSGVHKRESISLLIDLGTNGEVVIGSSQGMLAASCAAGPALEGYGITRGMRAMSGAIESVAIDRGTGEVFYRTIAGAKPRGICGSGVVDSIVAMLAAGVLETSGRILVGTSDRVVERGKEKAFVIVSGKDSADGKDIVLTQGDIRRFQLAKAAIYSASSVLMSKMKVGVQDVEHLYVAGAFGNYISPVNAMIVGLLPEIPTDRVTQIGNGSGMGACALLMDKGLWKDAELISKRVQPVELNLVPGFEKEYVDATFLPHKREDLFMRSRATVRSMVEHGR